MKNRKKQDKQFLLVNEIFRSIDGEVNTTGGQGVWTVFLRLAGCNLTCDYCDTGYARNTYLPDNQMHIDEVVNHINFLQREMASNRVASPRLTVTGGEPFLQQEALAVCLERLRGSLISVETNGSLRPIIELSMLVNCFVVDYKLKSSGMNHMMLPIEKYFWLRRKDILKFVVNSEEDVIQACQIAEQIERKCEVHPRKAISPTQNVSKKRVFELMEENKMFDFIYNLQLHKIIGAK